ncbi:SAV_915 family protein [Amycolatopsis arida]|uniref:SAV_915 family protein n=1 Tax=Amycolatopsis arida TaxID=587909 RepID=UPI000B845C25|nr:SAV_915 family protein [Amycolatopsis arida]
MEVSRPLLGTELIADDEAPTVLYTPTAAPLRGAEAALVLRELADGRRAMLVFTSLDRLVDGCGDEQPWLALRAEAIEEFRYLAQADTVLWDALIDPADRQYGEPDDSEV